MSDYLDALEQVCDEATPGERCRIVGDYGRYVGNESIRVLTGHLPFMFRVETPDPQHHKDAVFLTTFSPDVVRELIHRARRLEDIEAFMGIESEQSFTRSRT